MSHPVQTAVFLDLDDTVFQTLPKCPPGEPARPVACRRDGTPLSYMTDRQRALLELLARADTVVPTTARNLDAFRRVDLPFTGPAILDFGGAVLLPGGTLDPDWDALIRPQALAAADELAKLHREVAGFIAAHGLGANARLIADFDMPLYVVVKHPQADLSALAAVRDHLLPTLDPGRFFVHHNDNNLSLVPRFLGKEHAVRHVLDNRLGPGPVLSVGVADSLTDLPFLRLCDFLLVPGNSQLARQWPSG